MQLWDHQSAAAEAACAHLAPGGRATILAACGTGKTTTGAAIADRTSPSATSSSWSPRSCWSCRRSPSTRCGWEIAPVGCSRSAPITPVPTVHTTDTHAVHDELDRRRIPATTDPERIAAYLAGPGRSTVVTTYASLHALTRAHLPTTCPPGSSSSSTRPTAPPASARAPGPRCTATRTAREAAPLHDSDCPHDPAPGTRDPGPST